MRPKVHNLLTKIRVSLYSLNYLLILPTVLKPSEEYLIRVEKLPARRGRRIRYSDEESQYSHGDWCNQVETIRFLTSFLPMRSDGSVWGIDLVLFLPNLNLLERSNKKQFPS